MLKAKKSDDIHLVWKINGCSPRDPRNTIPVSKYNSFCTGTTLPDDWRRPQEQPIQFYSRHNEETTYLKFSLANRCSEWSTLRQMLPSTRLYPIKRHPLRNCPMST